MSVPSVRIIRVILLTACVCFAAADPSRAIAQATSDKAPPKLILQITVDQLRGDLARRYLQNMGPGGFRYLLDNGVIYENAHHAHANTETIVGHTTLATGAYPSAHGLIGNVWLDRATGEMKYNIEDARYPLLTAGADVDKATEIDPTQRVARTEGRSPAAMLTSTFSDELAIHTVRGAKVFGVSIKDRGAVPMAGHAGKAFWFSKASGQFVSSRYYYERYPEWVTTFNKSNPTQRYANQHWQLLLDRGEYHFADLDDVPWETELGEYGRVFPHPYGPGDGKMFTTLLTISPAGDELTLDFAKQLIEHEAIGVDEVTDYLSLSFSSTDYVGHVFGPSSLEMEDNLLRLDRTLADLFSYVDSKVGLNNTLIVLSADHGGPEVPAQLRQLGFEADYVDPSSWDKQPGIARLKKQFGVGDELIEKFFAPYVYLNREVIRERGLDQAAVERAVAEEITKFAGVALAVSSTALMQGQIAETPLTRSILHSHNPRRSGDLFVVFEPHCFINDFDGLTVAATHGSPWRYDTYVPIMFAGAGIQPQRVLRKVWTIDVAPTLAALVGAKPPSGASGEILQEVFD
ncbi:MAG: alkaline phosphatase family protein [bacterium]|nr:alkaline phosphatase family protein [bacterium]